PPFGAILAAPEERAIRYHMTSGTTGSTPLRVLDSMKDWEWIAEMWCYGLWGFGVRPADALFVAFGYATFIGFWGLHYAGEKLGCLVLPGGAMTTEQRVKQIVEVGATVVASTPTYALRMAQEAKALGLDLAGSRVERLILSGEPAGSIPATKRLIEEQWGAGAGRRHEARPRHERLPARGGGHRPGARGDRRVPDPPVHGGRDPRRDRGAGGGHERGRGRDLRGAGEAAGRRARGAAVRRAAGRARVAAAVRA